MDKNPEQTRVPFPDYTPENQERDFKKYQARLDRDIYIVKIKDNYGAYLPDGEDNICYENFTAKNLKDFYTAAKRFYNKLDINPKFHCVLNEGIENHILQQIQVQKLLGR